MFYILLNLIRWLHLKAAMQIIILYNEFLTIKCKIRIQETKIGSKEPMIIYLHDLSNRQICMTVDGIAQN